MLRHGRLSKAVIECFYEVYNELPLGLYEHLYVDALALALRSVGHRAEREVPAPVHFRGQVLGLFRMDLVVDDTLVIEAKAATRINDAHRRQLSHYLRVTNFEVGLLLNFGVVPEFRRVLLTNDMKQRSHP